MSPEDTPRHERHRQQQRQPHLLGRRPASSWRPPRHGSTVDRFVIRARRRRPHQRALRRVRHPARERVPAGYEATLHRHDGAHPQACASRSSSSASAPRRTSANRPSAAGPDRGARSGLRLGRARSRPVDRRARRADPDYLRGLGFRDVEVIGCPSMFFDGDRLAVAKRRATLATGATLAMNVSPVRQAHGRRRDSPSRPLPEPALHRPGPRHARAAAVGRAGADAWRSTTRAPSTPSIRSSAKTRVRFFVDPWPWIEDLRDASTSLRHAHPRQHRGAPGGHARRSCSPTIRGRWSWRDTSRSPIGGMSDVTPGRSTPPSSTRRPTTAPWCAATPRGSRRSPPTSTRHGLSTSFDDGEDPARSIPGAAETPIRRRSTVASPGRAERAGPAARRWRRAGRSPGPGAGASTRSGPRLARPRRAATRD